MNKSALTRTKDSISCRHNTQLPQFPIKPYMRVSRLLFLCEDVEITVVLGVLDNPLHRRRTMTRYPRMSKTRRSCDTTIKLSNIWKTLGLDLQSISTDISLQYWRARQGSAVVIGYHVCGFSRLTICRHLEKTCRPAQSAWRYQWPETEPTVAYVENTESKCPSVVVRNVLVTLYELLP